MLKKFCLPKFSNINFWAIFACIPSSIIIIMWHSMHKEYPLSDASEYWSVALRILTFMKEHSFIEWYEFYSIRTWKPIIFPQIGAIFLIISGGSTAFMTGATHFIFNLLLCIWFYTILRIYTDRVFAAVGTIIYTTIPSFLGWGFFFYGDLAFYSLGVGVVCHLLKSENFTKKNHSIFFAITFALAACVRPVETVSILILPLAVYYHRLSKFNGVKFYKINQLLLTFVVFLAAVGFAFLTDEFFGHKWIRITAKISLTISTLSLIFIVIKSFKTEKDHFIKSVSLALLLTLLWWMDSVAQLYNWIHECTVGESTKNSYTIDHQQYMFGSLDHYVRGAGYSQILLPLILLAAFFFFNLLSKNGRKFLKEERKVILQEPLFLFSFLSFIIIMIIVTPMIPAFDARRGLLSYLLFAAGILVLLFRFCSRKKITHYLTIIILACFCAVQVNAVFARIYGTSTKLDNLVSNIHAAATPKTQANSKIMIEWLYENYFKNNPDCTEENPCNVLLLTHFSDPFTIMMLNDFVYRNKTLSFKAQYVSHQSDSILEYHNHMKSLKNNFYIFLEVDPKIKKYDINYTSNFFFQFYGNLYLGKNLKKYDLYEVDKNKILTFTYLGHDKKVVMLKQKK